MSPGKILKMSTEIIETYKHCEIRIAQTRTRRVFDLGPLNYIPSSALNVWNQRLEAASWTCTSAVCINKFILESHMLAQLS